jgi:hypothetical protein
MAMSFTPEELLRYADSNRLEEWIHSFLTTVGGNEPLSIGLKLQPRYWLGPVQLPLASLTRCLGPEEGMEYRVPMSHWEESTTAMLTSMRKGWRPPPLIAVYTEDGSLSVRDGNHRHGALVKAGIHEHWTVVWCNTEAERRRCRRQYPLLTAE